MDTTEQADSSNSSCSSDKDSDSGDLHTYHSYCIYFMISIAVADFSDEDIEHHDDSEETISGTIILCALFHTMFLKIEQCQESIYHGSLLTLRQCLVLLLTFISRHKLTNVAILDLLSLLQLICPSPNTLPNSLHYFWKLVSAKNTSQHHYICHRCMDILQEDSENCPTCRSAVCQPKKYFTTLHIHTQLKSLFQSRHFSVCVCVLVCGRVVRKRIL